MKLADRNDLKIVKKWERVREKVKKSLSLFQIWRDDNKNKKKKRTRWRKTWLSTIDRWGQDNNNNLIAKRRKQTTHTHTKFPSFHDCRWFLYVVCVSMLRGTKQNKTKNVFLRKISQRSEFFNLTFDSLCFSMYPYFLFDYHEMSPWFRLW